MTILLLALMVSAVICFVKSKNAKTRRRASEEMMRSRSDQLLHVILERSFSVQPGSINGPQSTLPKTTCNAVNEQDLKQKKNFKKNNCNTFYPVLRSDSDLESVC